MPSLALRAALLLAVLAGFGGIACSTEEGGRVPRPTRTPVGEYLLVGPEERFQSIGEAIEEARPGTTVIVHAGTYREQVELRDGISLEAYGDGAATIDGECERDYGVWVPAGSGTAVRGMTVRNTRSAGIIIGNGPEDQSRPENVTVENNDIADFNCIEEDGQYQAGIAAWYACCVTARNNLITYRSEGDGHGRGNGIWFKSNSERPSGGGHMITGNVITGGWDGIGGENEDDPHGGFDRDTVIEGNSISDCWDDGIQAEGGNANVRIAGNQVARCGTGIAFAPTLVGPLTIERNVIRDLEVGLYENQFCFKAGNAGEGTVYLTENICTTEGSGLSQTNDGIATIVSRGNCFRVTRYAIELRDELPEGSGFTEDRLWSSDESRLVKWLDVQYGSLSAFQRETGEERGGRQSPECPLR